MNSPVAARQRTVHVRKGQTTLVQMRTGVAIEITHLASGAVIVRNASSGGQLRTWGPKDRG